MSDYDSPQPHNPLWTSRADITTDQKVGMLPTRGEKRLIFVEDKGSVNVGNIYPQDSPGSNSEDLWSGPFYEAITMAKKTLTDYVLIRIPNRVSGNSTDSYFTYRFLINPKSVSISRQTMDSVTPARGGYQFGIWGEDTLDIHMSGTTAGQYFSAGLTSRWKMYSQSFRNIMELVNVFENNGYFFEGEEVNTSYVAPDWTRKRIKCHGDVQLIVGNFQWSGMFTELTVTNSADTPYFSTFELGFLAWKERFINDSPWLNMIENNVVRGHDVSLLTELDSGPEETNKNPTQSNENPPSTPTDMANANLNLASGLGPILPPPTNSIVPNTVSALFGNNMLPPTTIPGVGSNLLAPYIGGGK